MQITEEHFVITSRILPHDPGLKSKAADEALSPGNLVLINQVNHDNVCRQPAPQSSHHVTCCGEKVLRFCTRRGTRQSAKWQLHTEKATQQIWKPNTESASYLRWCQSSSYRKLCSSPTTTDSDRHSPPELHRAGNPHAASEQIFRSAGTRMIPLTQLGGSHRLFLWAFRICFKKGTPLCASQYFRVLRRNLLASRYQLLGLSLKCGSSRIE